MIDQPTTSPVVLAWSGGKDCALALAELRERDPRAVACLLTTVTTGHERISMHGVRRALLHRQAHAAGLPLREVEIPPACTNEAYDRAMSAALVGLERDFPDARDVAFGDLLLEDVRRYREERLAAAGRRARFPLWGRDTRSVAHEIVARGIRAVLVCVDTAVLPAEFAGRGYDEALLRDLPAGIDPCGENGEFHTFVHAGPMFDAAVPFARGEVVVRDGRFAYCDLLPVERPTAAGDPFTGGTMRDPRAKSDDREAPLDEARPEDLVTEASEESFPASDPPAFVRSHAGDPAPPEPEHPE